MAKYSTALDQTYSVTKGSPIQAEITIENNGSVAQSNYVKFYMSTDRTISTSDTLVSTTYMYVSPDSPLTTVYATSIPSTLTSGGTYYLGAIIDPNSTLSEVNENNNAVYLSTIRVNRPRYGALSSSEAARASINAPGFGRAPNMDTWTTFRSETPMPECASLGRPLVGMTSTVISNALSVAGVTFTVVGIREPATAFTLARAVP